MHAKPTAVLIFIALLCASPIPARAQSYGGELVVTVGSDPKTFNPITASETSSSTVAGVLFEGLTTEDPKTFEVIPNLANHWDVDSQGTTWTFYLRHDVQWFDGKPLTADDVLFTFNDCIYNPDIPSSSRDVLTIEGKPFKVEKIDAYIVRFTLPVKFAPFLRAMSQPILPKHGLERAVQSKKFNFTWGIDTPVHEIVGTGPFYLDQYLPGEKIVFKRNPHYWKKTAKGDALPYLDKVIYLIIPDSNTALLKFIDGEIDAVGVSGTDYPLLKPLEGQKHFHIYEAGADFGSNFIALNLNFRTNPKTHAPYVDPIKLSWFKNLNFRRAIAHAIDKPQIIQILFKGFGYPQNSPMSPSSGYFYNAHVKSYEYDLNKAAALLKEAGFVKDAQGHLHDAQGHAVEFNLLTAAGGAERTQIGAIIRSDLERLGMKVNLLTLEFNSLVTKLMATYDWDAVILGLTGGIEPHFGKNVWHSSGGLHLWNPRQSAPATDWEKRLDEIYDQGVQELDQVKRKTLYDEFQTIAAEQLPVIYTVLNTDMYAIRTRFGNLNPTPMGGPFHNLEEIYVSQ